MRVRGQNRKTMLHRTGRYPGIVDGNRLTGLAQAGNNDGITARGFRIDAQNRGPWRGQEAGQILLVLAGLAGISGAAKHFANDYRRNKDSFATPQDITNSNVPPGQKRVRRERISKLD